MNVEVNVLWLVIAIIWALQLFFARARLEKRVGDLEIRLEKLLHHVGFDADMRPPVSDDVGLLARTPGGKIAAIKAYREQTGAGLKEAKDEVERLMRIPPAG